MTQPGSSPAEAAEESRPIRPLRATFRRHRLLIITCFCLLTSLLFFLTPRLSRTYRVSALLDVKFAQTAAIPELTKLPPKLLDDVIRQNPAVHASLTSHDGESRQSLALWALAGTRAAAVVRLHAAADQFALRLSHEADELGDSFRTLLTKQQDKLADEQKQIARQIDLFQRSHRGVLPDDPTSITAQYEKLTAKLDEKQQRQRLVNEQIARLEQYKNKVGQNQNVPLPPALPPPVETTTSAPAAPDRDPEVMALDAQLQLINEQIDEQLQTRTEQHPYVVDLRTQLKTIEKKLQVAKERAAAGKPAPPTRGPVIARGPDPTLAAAEQVDLQLAQLGGEQAALNAEIQTLTGQIDGMKHDVDQVVPARHEYEALQSRSQEIAHEQSDLAAKLDAFDRTRRALPAVDISPLTLDDASTLPVFPRLSVVYPLALLLGAVAAIGAGVLMHRTDTALHDAREARAAFEIPVLGAVSEIRSPVAQAARRLHRSFIRPALMAGMALLVLVGAVRCYQNLADASSSGLIDRTMLPMPAAMNGAWNGIGNDSGRFE